jgi:hypothetical protein
MEICRERDPSYWVYLVPRDSYRHLANDILRLSCVQVVMHLLLHLQSPGTHPLFSVAFALLLVYMALGLATYWLVVRQLISVNTTTDVARVCGRPG